MEKANFFRDVQDVARQIPFGRVTSYGAIANYLGAKSSSRMVGYAMAASAGVSPPVPAHRVLNRQGMLTGKIHFKPASLMQQLLESEGIEVVDDQVVNFNTIFWDPAKELEL
ncbi:MGMT family protein [Rubrolithibacter danxiaensis]|uniref:MGMT family protein n=1 Tax=Rubrolithibacter danxiaensis TaxID=3390805 RepID=UPI003BF7ECBC